MTEVAWHNERMKQSALSLDLTNWRTRKRAFQDGMEGVVSRNEFAALIEPQAPTKATRGRPFTIKAMLRIHFLQQWFGLNDVAMAEALYDVPLHRSNLSGWAA